MTRAQRMTDLLESCTGFAPAVALLREACLAQFLAADGGELPELAALVKALEAAEAAGAALDRATE